MSFPKVLFLLFVFLFACDEKTEDCECSGGESECVGDRLKICENGCDWSFVPCSNVCLDLSMRYVGECGYSVDDGFDVCFCSEEPVEQCVDGDFKCETSEHGTDELYRCDGGWWALQGNCNSICKIYDEVYSGVCDYDLILGHDFCQCKPTIDKDSETETEVDTVVDSGTTVALDTDSESDSNIDTVTVSDSFSDTDRDSENDTETNADTGADTVSDSLGDYYSVSGFLSTVSAVSMDADLNSVCEQEFGFAWRIADWRDIMYYYANAGDLEQFFEDVELFAPNSLSRFVLRDGEGYYSSDRHYYITRHDHDRPDNYLAHDNIDSYLLSLGSWDGDKRALCTSNTEIFFDTESSVTCSDCGTDSDTDSTMDSDSESLSDSDSETDSDAGMKHPGPCIIDRDANADGIADERRSFSYNDNGDVLTELSDWGVDGTVDSSLSYTYNTFNLLTLEELDRDYDGTIDYRETYYYENNKLNIEDIDNDADGIPDTRYRFTYDVDGNLLLTETDKDVDGTYDDILIYSYSNNLLFGKEWDEGIDGVIDRRWWYLYDLSSTRVVSEGLDSDADGHDDIQWNYTYNAAGDITRLETDNYADGIVDTITAYTYDRYGNLLSIVSDGNLDDIPDEVYTYSYYGCWK